MSSPVAPGDPGYDPDRWFQHVVNVGIGLARRFGTGLQLFNALRSHFAGVARDILGAASRIIGQGIRAAITWMNGGPDHVVDLGDVPLAPKGFFGPEEVNRIVGIVDVPGEASDSGLVTYHQTRVNWPENWSKAAIADAIEETALETEMLSPGTGWDVDKDMTAHMLWIGKRF